LPTLFPPPHLAVFKAALNLNSNSLVHCFASEQTHFKALASAPYNLLTFVRWHECNELDRSDQVKISCNLKNQVLSFNDVVVTPLSWHCIEFAKVHCNLFNRWYSWDGLIVIG
jgi:hypothetical protein